MSNVEVCRTKYQPPITNYDKKGFTILLPGLGFPALGPDGGIGRRAGLKIQFPLKECGFDPHSGHQLRILTGVASAGQSETILVCISGFRSWRFRSKFFG